MAWKTEGEFHQDLGKFCADFEIVCHEMEVCIRVILHKHGLQNPDIQETLLSGLTAEPLAKLLQSLVSQTIAMDDNKRSIFTKVFKKIRDLTEHRNSLIHAKWYSYGKGLEEEEQEVVSVGQRLYANKQGADTQRIIVDQSKLNELIQECRDAAIVVSLVIRCIQDIRTTEECFSTKDGSLVINYEALRPIKIHA